MVSASDLRSEGREFGEPTLCSLVKHELSQCLSPPRCVNGNQQINLETT